MEKLFELFQKKEKFLLGIELVGTRRIIQQDNGQKLMSLVEELCKFQQVDWISFTDNAGGNPMTSPEFLGGKVLSLWKNAVINITCKDNNRNFLESKAWQYASEGFDNVMALTGDYYYQPDPETNLPDINKKNERLINYRRSNYSKYNSLSYHFSRLVHASSFKSPSSFLGIHRAYYKWSTKGTSRRCYNLSYFHERMIKSALFNCQECGDFSLPDITYLCSESPCAKNQRSGLCGGRNSDKCEVTKFGKHCIWVKAYNRNNYFNRDKVRLLDRPVVLKDNNLFRTSGWGNFFLEKDHSAKTKSILRYSN